MKKEIYIDGSGYSGSRSGYSIYENNNNFVVNFKNEEFTNNYMEYTALINALQSDQFIKHGDDVIIYTDSNLVYRQIIGEYKIKDFVLKKLFNSIKQLMEQKKINSNNIRWVHREENKAGILLDKIKRLKIE